MPKRTDHRCVVRTCHQVGEVLLLVRVVDLDHLLWRLPMHPPSCLFGTFLISLLGSFSLPRSPAVFAILHLSGFILGHSGPDLFDFLGRGVFRLRLHPPQASSPKHLKLHRGVKSFKGSSKWFMCSLTALLRTAQVGQIAPTQQFAVLVCGRPFLGLRRLLGSELGPKQGL